MRTMVFECRFGGLHGWGHLSRCCAVAQAAKARGWRTVLWSPSPIAEAASELREAFDEVLRSDAEGGAAPREASEASVVLVDEMYWKDHDYERLRIRLGERALVVATDDMQARQLASVDVVINPELGLEKAGYRPRRASLLGERYCMLRAGFGQPVRSIWDPGPERLPVFVMIGGTDAFGHGPRVLEALSRIDDQRFAPVYVCGHPGARTREVDERLAQFAASRFLSGLSSPELAGWMAACRFGVIGCATSAFELAAVGRPFVGLSVVDNQTRFADKIARLWRMPVLGVETAPFEQGAFERAVQTALAMPEGSRAPRVDSQGCQRIMDTIEGAMP